MTGTDGKTPPIDPTLHVAHTENFGNAVMIEFGDGTSALFPGSFLREHSAPFLLDTKALEEM